MRHTRPICLICLILITLLLSGIAYAQDATTQLHFYIPLATNGHPPAQPTPPPIDALAYRREVIRLVNEYRVANGCPAAAENATLMGAAQAWSDYMLVNNYRGHSAEVDPEWYKHHGYSSGAQENIGLGYDTPQEVVNGWKNSPNHNRTLLWCYYADRGYVYDLGVGLSGGRLWTLALGERLP
jgi:uncharacterized protein YkwD